MMKKMVLIVLVLLISLFSISCSNKTVIDENQLRVSEEIGMLKERMRNDPSDKETCKELARKYFELDMAKARAEGVTEGNEPFFLESNSTTGVVLIHGFSASPYELKELGQYLNRKGMNVYGVLLAGHGCDYKDFGNYDYHDWIKSTDNGLNAIRACSDKVYVGGTSLGGDIALDLAKTENFSGIFVIGAPIKFKDDSIKYSGIIRWFINTLPNKNLKEKDMPHYYYNRSVNAVYNLNEFIKDEVVKDLDKIDEPILIMQSVNDITVDADSAKMIYNMTTSSKDKKMIMYLAYSHIIVNEMEKDKLFYDVYKFIEENNRQISLVS